MCHFKKEKSGDIFLPKNRGLLPHGDSLVECVKFLLRSGMPYVLTERFNQDNVEEYFGKQRSMGRRSDNPNMHQFGYNANAIRIQRSICVTTGNASGKYSGLMKKKSWVNVDMEPLAKRRESSNLILV